MKRLCMLILFCFALFPLSSYGQVQTGNVLVTKQTIAESDTLPLAAPGDFPAIATAGYKYVTVAVLTRTINTSCTFRFLGKKKKLGWGNLDNDSDSTIVAVNRLLFKTYAYVAGIDSFKVEYTSQAGGTTALPAVQYTQWNETAYGFDW